MRKDKDERNDESANHGWRQDEMCYIRCPAFQLQSVLNVNIFLFTAWVLYRVANGGGAGKFKFRVLLKVC